MAKAVPEVRYIYLRPAEVVRRRRELPLAWLPLGVIEWHGLHNPFGVDIVKAEAALCHAARRIGGLVMPPLCWGDHRRDIAEVAFNPAKSPWYPQHLPDQTEAIARETGVPVEMLQREADRMIRQGGWDAWKAVAVHVLYEIESMGFGCIAAYCGHGPLTEPFQQAVATYRAGGGACQVIPLDFPGGEDHAALRETSLMLALCPGLSDLAELDASGSRTIGTLGDDPRKASAELGWQMVGEFEAEARRRLAKWSAFPPGPVTSPGVNPAL